MSRKLVPMILLIALLLAACGGQAATTEAPAGSTPAASGNKVEVTWYVRATPAENEWQNKVVTDFEAQNPDIKINLMIVKWEDFDTKLQTLVAGGTAPDIWSHWGASGFRDYVLRGMVADLSPYIQKNNFDLSDFNQDVLQIYKVDGKVMGLPLLTTGSYVFYNKDLFDAAGLPYPPTRWDDPTWTWGKFIETAKQLTKNVEDPATTQWGAALGGWPADLYVWMFGQNTYTDESYKTGMPDKTFWSSPAAISAYQAYQDAIYVDKVAPDAVASQGFGDQGAFESGRVAMTIDGGWKLWQFANPPLHEKFRWGTAALPSGAPGARPVLFTDPWMLSAHSQHPDEAARFLLYLASKDVQQSFSKVAGTPPVRKSLLEEWYKNYPSMKPEELKEVFEGSLKVGGESPNHLIVGFDQINKLVGTALDPVKNNTARSADALAPLESDLTSLIDQLRVDLQ